ncbi:MAG TPA: hypothetical protein VEZ20_12295 [Allosphingosinicella sp.]|nr:hypothetical protein [Allosphingosinicella sp.]
MTLPRLAACAGALAALAACSTSREAPPAPAPAPAPVVQRPAPPRPQPVVPDSAWIDAPLAPGDWTQEGSVARYGAAGAPSFIVRCVAPGQVSIVRAGMSASPSMTVRTSSASGALPARASAAGVEASLPASDPLLDAMFYSRGRYSIEVHGLPRLIVPSWPEPARIVEDCRG